MNAIWEAMNSPLGIMVVGALLAWLLKRVYLARPAWKVYEGTIIAAIKRAEKAIPDGGGAVNKGWDRLNSALNYVLQVYRGQEGHAATAKVEAELREAIGVKHAELEKGGNLAKNSATKIPVRHAD